MYLTFKIDTMNAPDRVDFAGGYKDGIFDIDDNYERIISLAKGYVKNKGYLKKRLINSSTLFFHDIGLPSMYAIVCFTTKPNTILNRIKKLFGRTVNDAE